MVEEHRERFGVEPTQALWACRRPLTISAPLASDPRALEDDRLLGRDPWICTSATTSPTAPGGRGRHWGRAGEQVGRGRVERLMRQNGIQGAKRRGKPWRQSA